MATKDQFNMIKRRDHFLVIVVRQSTETTHRFVGYRAFLVCHLPCLQKEPQSSAQGVPWWSPSQSQDHTC